MEQIKITRIEEWCNKRFNYKIFVNGEEQFEIANGQERFVTVENGATIQAKLMWCGSERVNLTTEKGQIKELKVKANKGPNMLFPVLALTVLILCGVVNVFYPDNGGKVFMTSIIVGIMIYALCLVTIWRNKFIEIELVTE